MSNVSIKNNILHLIPINKYLLIFYSSIIMLLKLRVRISAMGVERITKDNVKFKQLMTKIIFYIIFLLNIY